ncbi:MAG: hypothetical protein AABX11_02535 [Nanoarchaeota archaeon]
MARADTRLAYYHSLAAIQRGFKSDEDRREFVAEYPVIAGEIFYYLNDRTLGKMVARTYATHPRAEMRELAKVTKLVFMERDRIKAMKESSLSVSLNMNSVPLLSLQEEGIELSEEEKLDRRVKY